MSLTLLKKVVYDIRPSKIHGVGLFANVNIPNKSIVFKYSCTDPKDVQKVRITDIKKNNKNLLNVLLKWYAHDDDYIEIPKSFDPYTIHIASLINHSDHPNLVYKNGIYRAIHNIKRNTEFTINYNDNHYSHETN